MPDDKATDRFAIRECYGHYAVAASLRDEAEWISCWSQDAVWKTPHFEVAGHAALSQMWAVTWTNFKSVSAFNEIGRIALDGDTAHVISSVYEIMTPTAGGLVKMAGLYTDSLVRDASGWRFARREYQLISQEQAA